MVKHMQVVFGTPQVPDSIDLFGFKIKTLYHRTLLADREQFGEYCQRTMTITLDGNLSEQRKALTYCHELVEAIADINHLTMDEQTKQAMGLALHQLLMQGKLLFAVAVVD